MSQAHEYLRQLLGVSPAGPEPHAGPLPHPWHQVKLAFHQVMQDRSPESEDVLHRFLLFQGELPLQPTGEFPHALSPEDHLRMLAMQTLAGWDREKHRAAIIQAAGLADSDAVGDMARAVLQ